MSIALILVSTACLIVLSIMGIPMGRMRHAAKITYGGSMVICLLALSASAAVLLGLSDTNTTIVLPVGLPWLGAHFRLDALSAFFLVVVDFGAAAPAYLRWAMPGTRAPQNASCRSILPSSAGMNLVVLADDAFTFLFAWEFMSLAPGRL